MHGNEMMILEDIVIVLGLSVLIILLFQRFRLPSLLAFLISGIIIGPFGLSLIEASQVVQYFSETGIILLLFIIGIEFSLKDLGKVKGTVFGAGSLQILVTIGIIAVLAHFMNLPWRESVFVGFIFSMSSTAIVLKILQERGEINTSYGRVVLAVLIFQDLMIVPLMLVTPLLAGNTVNVIKEVFILLAKVTGLIGILFLLARFILPKILRLVVRTRSRELFLLTITVICFGTAWLTSTIGLSLALGAFFAGLLLSETPYRHQTVALVLPFREIFLSFFFISIGMLLDVRFFMEHLAMILILGIVIILIKFLIVTTAVLIFKYTLKTALLSGFALFQVGEFAFILSATGLSNGLLSVNIYQYFLAISIISMGITPIVMHFSGRISDTIVRSYLKKPVRTRLDTFIHAREQAFEQFDSLSDHLVIIGYGISGKTLAFAAKKARIRYIILEHDPIVFEKGQKAGQPIVFGDGTSEEILRHLHVPTARIIVVATGDPNNTFTIVEKVRRMNASAYIIAKAKGMSAIEKGIIKGANEVIPSDFQTSLEIFALVLRQYMKPEDEISDFIDQIRAGHYEIFRKKNHTDLS
ncbi:MAG: cation:proton antiporter [Bacteroidota bacterium]|nr:cation:proton antiporter [Bacteroidota bacterium]